MADVLQDADRKPNLTTPMPLLWLADVSPNAGTVA